MRTRGEDFFPAEKRIDWHAASRLPWKQIPKEIEMKRMMMIMFIATLSLTPLSWANDTDAAATADRLEMAGDGAARDYGGSGQGHSRRGAGPREVRCGCSPPGEGWIHLWRGRRQRRSHLPDSDGWSAPAFFAITGGSWGPQIGVEGVDLVMIVQSDKGMQRLLSSKFQLGGDASAAAGPVGRHASADTDWKMNAEILTYSRAKGIFAGLDLSGAAVRRDDDSMKTVYGPDMGTRAVLDGRVSPTPAAQPFLDSVRNAREQARASSE